MNRAGCWLKFFYTGADTVPEFQYRYQHDTVLITYFEKYKMFVYKQTFKI